MATFQLNLINFTQQQQTIFNQVCAVWGATLQNNVTIRIQAQVLPFPAQVGHLEAMCVPNFVQGNQNGINTTVTVAQAKAIASGDFTLPPPQTYDMVVFINQNVTFSYVNVPSNHSNFFTVCLHEICHGLGFVGICNVGMAGSPPQNIGIFTDPTLLAILAPMQALIPFWNTLTALQANYPTYFGQQFQSVQSAVYIYTDPPPTIYNYFTTQNSMEINYINQVVNEAYDVFSPAQFVPFSSCDHINYPVGCLMYYALGTQIILTPDYRTKNILSLIGWGIAP